MKFDSANIEIRELRASDFAAIISIAELLEESPQWSSETFIQMLSGEFRMRRIALVATHPRSGAVLGFTVASMVAPEAELENIAVAQDFQRHGIGRQLLLKLVSELRLSGIKTLHLEVRASNLAAIRLYNSFEFNETGRRPRYYSDPIEDAVLMTLYLS